MGAILRLDDYKDKVLLNLSEDKQIAVEFVFDRVFRTKKLTGRIFKLVDKIEDEKVKKREAEIENSILYKLNKLYFDPNTFECFEYEPYMFVQPIIEYM